MNQLLIDTISLSLSSLVMLSGMAATFIGGRDSMRRGE